MVGGEPKAKTSSSTFWKSTLEFTVPDIRVNSDNYVDRISLSTRNLTEMRLTRHLSLKELQNNIKSLSYVGENITCFSHHTEVIARFVNLDVNQAAASVCGTEELHTFILLCWSHEIKFISPWSTTQKLKIFMLIIEYIWSKIRTSRSKLKKKKVFSNHSNKHAVLSLN